MELSIQILLCSYLNGCNSCSNVTIGTAVNVSNEDWSACTDTRQFNMTVTNSDSVLYKNSTTCCSGNLTIHFGIGNFNSFVYIFIYTWMRITGKKGFLPILLNIFEHCSECILFFYLAWFNVTKINKNKFWGYPLHTLNMWQLTKPSDYPS